MIPATHRQIRLAARPTGYPTDSDFRIVESPVPEPGPAEFLVRVVYLSLDPYMRGRMSDAPSYVPPVTVGDVMEGGTVGEVLVSEHGMPREKAEQAGLYNVLASAVGARDMTPAVDFLSLEHGDTLMLCTDGLTKHVSDSRIAEVLGNTSDAETGCRSLIDLALSGGGSDNVKAVVARVLAG